MTLEPAPPPTTKVEVNPQDVVRVEIDLTNILLTAIDKNKRFVTTLRQEDVRVLENDVPQEVFTFQRETDLPLSLAILIDVSKSQELTLPDEKAAARLFVDSILRPEKDHAAIISFTGYATLEQELTNNVASLQRAIDRVQIVYPADGGGSQGGVTPVADVDLDPTSHLRGWTGIWDAMWVSVNEVLSQTPGTTRRAIILLTDGEDTSSRVPRDEAVDRAVKANVVVYAIGIGDRDRYNVYESILRKVSEKTGGRAFFPKGKTDLQAAFEQIQQELRSQYLIAYSSTNKMRDGTYRKVRIEIVNPELRKQKLRLLYRQGYYAKQQAATRTN
ncbi:MAG TPA: VWA domain-containing protein [Pyrinomonadaceae bacterium]|nr:VWA domain-containing protein [Pyrinomonadaceae bacterium]